ncbi:hypothetical protein PQX77_018511 [Marasmius sp. AFHP31]|nr:hypothetical protein PQX77_018511 [Marasmius sp. AFHP31]
MSVQFPTEPLQVSQSDRRERFANLQKKLKDDRKLKQKAEPIPTSSRSSSEGSPHPGPSNSQNMPSTPFPVAPNNKEEEDFIADDPEQYSNDRTNIMNYWLNLSRDPDADAKMRQALKEYGQNARVEQERRQRGASQFQEILQYNPELREILSDWKNIKKELEEGRDLRRRYLARHGGASGSGCGPCGGNQQHPASGCSEQSPDNNVVVNLMRDDPASVPKQGILQTLKCVTWAAGVKEPETPLPTYTAQATPAPAYTISTKTAGEIDPEAYSDTEVFVQHAHEFDSPGSGSSRYPDVTNDPGDPGDEPSDNKNGDDNPFGRDSDHPIPRPGKERETPFKDPDFEATNQKSLSFFIHEDELRSEIRRINREERERAVPAVPAVPTVPAVPVAPVRADVLEDRYEREA